MNAAAWFLALLGAWQGPLDLMAPSDFAHLVPRLSRESRALYGNLYYEGNNVALRAPEADDAPRCADAERTRRLAARTAGLFLLRDALFSQQDNPVLGPACALMMPPNWVTVAVDDAHAGRVTRPVARPDLEDTAAWMALVTPESLFGGFPASETLHGWAVRDDVSAASADQRRIRNARTAVHSLAVAADRLLSAATKGPEAVAEAGAELIAESDRRYFGEDVRRDHVIPLVVENPSRHEVVEAGKGLVVASRIVAPEALELTRRAIYRRRLQDGPIALERYDLTSVAEVRRCVEVLEMLAPSGSSGHRIFVWVGGPLIPGTERVAEAGKHLPAFFAALRVAEIEMSRITVFVRPVFQSGGKTRADLGVAAERVRAEGALFGVNMSTPALQRLMAWP